jgi:hypothetical protein
VVSKMKVGSNVGILVPLANSVVSTMPTVVTATLTAGQLTLVALIPGITTLVTVNTDGSVNVIQIVVSA